MPRDDLIYTILAAVLVITAAWLRWYEVLGCLREYAWAVCVR